MANENYRIYLVDDDRFLLDMYAVKFRGAGHTVETAVSGSDLLEKLQKDQGKVDALLLDILMPGMTGFEALAEIRKQGLAKDAKVIILSNQGQDSDVETAKELGAVAYIVKASAIPSEVLARTLEALKKP